VYCVQVETGRERAWVSHLSSTGISFDLQTYWPRRKMYILKKGHWREDIIPLFKGYLFIESLADEGMLVDIVRRVPHFIRFLRSNSQVEQLSSADELKIRRLMQFGEVIPVSSGIVLAGKRIRIVSGPLFGLEGSVVEINARRRRVKVEVGLYDNMFRVDLGFEQINCQTSVL
jgi:transcription termination/antitermination protein NusG